MPPTPLPNYASTKIYYNRTPAKARELAGRFAGTVVWTLERSDLEPILPKSNIVMISTLPAAAEFQRLKMDYPEWSGQSSGRL